MSWLLLILSASSWFYYKKLGNSVYHLLLFYHLQFANRPTKGAWPFVIKNLDAHRPQLYYKFFGVKS